MSQTELVHRPLLLACVDIAQQAGRMILTEGFSKTPEKKSDGSFVTEADKESHAFITRRLGPLLPDTLVISEEGQRPQGTLSAETTYWLVDPIDGTHDFIDGLEEWGIHLALVVRRQAVLGVIEMPALAVTYYGAQDLGAYKQVGREEPAPLSYHRQRAAPTATVSPRYLDEQTQKMFQRWGVRETIYHGNAINPCIVAEGQADLYVLPKAMWYWDSAAGAAIAREAGCRALDLQGNAIAYPLQKDLRTDGLIIAAPTLSAAIRQSLAQNDPGPD